MQAEQGIEERLEAVFDTEVQMSNKLLSTAQELTALAYRLRSGPYVEVRTHLKDLIAVLQEIEEAGEALLEGKHDEAARLLQALSAPMVDDDI